MASPLNIALILRLVDKMTGPAKKVTNNFARIRKGWEQAQKQFRRAAEMRQAAEGVASFARKARAAIAAPISTFEDFEAAMSGVKAVTGGLSENEFTDLTKTAKVLGATTRFTATEAAGAMRFLGMAGFDAAEQMAAVPTVLNLAVAGSTDLSRTSDILSDIMGAFNKTAAQSVEVSDALAVTMTGSNVTLETMFETMKLVGPIATKMGISLSDVAAMTGLMGSAGIKGSLAGTALKSSILRLVAPTKNGAQFLKDLGVTTVDAAGNMRPMVQILDEVSKASAGLGTAQQGEMIKEIFGLRAVSGVATLLEKIKGGEVQKFAEEIENSTGAAAKMARVMGDNAKGATVRMTSAIDGMNTAIGERLEPTLTLLKETLTGIVQGLTAWVNEHSTITEVLAISVGAVAGFATVLSGLLFALTAGTTALGVFAAAFGSTQTGVQLLGGGIKGLIPMIKGLAASLLASPIFAFATAVAALTLAAAAAANAVSDAEASNLYETEKRIKKERGHRKWMEEQLEQKENEIDATRRGGRASTEAILLEASELKKNIEISKDFEWQEIKRAKQLRTRAKQANEEARANKRERDEGLRATEAKKTALREEREEAIRSPGGFRPVAEEAGIVTKENVDLLAAGLARAGAAGVARSEIRLKIETPPGTRATVTGMEAGGAALAVDTGPTMTGI